MRGQYYWNIVQPMFPKSAHPNNSRKCADNIIGILSSRCFRKVHIGFFVENSRTILLEYCPADVSEKCTSDFSSKMRGQYYWNIVRPMFPKSAHRIFRRKFADNIIGILSGRCFRKVHIGFFVENSRTILLEYCPADVSEKCTSDFSSKMRGQYYWNIVQQMFPKGAHRNNSRKCADNIIGILSSRCFRKVHTRTIVENARTILLEYCPADVSEKCTSDFSSKMRGQYYWNIVQPMFPKSAHPNNSRKCADNIIGILSSRCFRKVHIGFFVENSRTILLEYCPADVSEKCTSDFSSKMRGQYYWNIVRPMFPKSAHRIFRRKFADNIIGILSGRCFRKVHIGFFVENARTILLEYCPADVSEKCTSDFSSKMRGQYYWNIVRPMFPKSAHPNNSRKCADNIIGILSGRCFRKVHTRTIVEMRGKYYWNIVRPMFPKSAHPNNSRKCADNIIGILSSRCFRKVHTRTIVENARTILLEYCPADVSEKCTSDFSSKMRGQYYWNIVRPMFPKSAHRIFRRKFADNIIGILSGRCFRKVHIGFFVENSRTILLEYCPADVSEKCTSDFSSKMRGQYYWNIVQPMFPKSAHPIFSRKFADNIIGILSGRCFRKVHIGFFVENARTILLEYCPADVSEKCTSDYSSKMRGQYYWNIVRPMFPKSAHPNNSRKCADNIIGILSGRCFRKVHTRTIVENARTILLEYCPADVSEKCTSDFSSKMRGQYYWNIVRPMFPKSAHPNNSRKCADNIIGILSKRCFRKVHTRTIVENARTILLEYCPRDVSEKCTPEQ